MYKCKYEDKKDTIFNRFKSNRRDDPNFECVRDEVDYRDPYGASINPRTIGLV